MHIHMCVYSMQCTHTQMHVAIATHAHAVICAYVHQVTFTHVMTLCDTNCFTSLAIGGVKIKWSGYVRLLLY